MPRAFSYLRFSTPEQADGDSYRRQVEAAEAYADANGLTLDDTLNLHDRGLSGFSGANVRRGALGQFLEAIEAGYVKPGDYLLVENFDRLSRMDPWDVQPIMQQVINAGVILVTLQDRRVWTREGLRANPMDMLQYLIAMMRANEESRTKARRLSEVWKAKREKAGAGERLTAVCPAWLKPDASGKGFQVIQERAAVVQRIFRETMDGEGQNAITKRLNAESVPVFGRGEGWHRSYVVKILTNPAVIGTYVPHTKERDEAGKAVRKPQTPIPGYFPAVVDPETFAACEAKRLAGGTPKRGRHAAGTIQSLLAGLARCPECGGTMTRVMKGKRSRPMLVCQAAKRGAGCTYRSVPQADVEAAITGEAEKLCRNVPVGGDGDVDAALESAEAARDVAAEQVENLARALGAGFSPALRTQLDEAETTLADAKRAVENVGRRAAVAATPMLNERCARLLGALQADPMDPERVNGLMRQVFSGVVVDYRDGMLDFEWVNGGRTNLVFAAAGDPE